ncbi:MAG: hypothetical protein V4690_01805 [Patescibacteria group bacterium]
MSDTKTLGEVIRHMLDDSHSFTRKEWAVALGCTTRELRDWVANKKIPPDRKLRGIVDILRHRFGSPSPTLQEWDRISGLPISDVAPSLTASPGKKGVFFLPSVRVSNLATYTLSLRYSGILHRLTLLSEPEQEKVLDLLVEKFIPEAR